MVRMGPALARIGQPSPAMSGSATAAAPSGSFFACPFENAVDFLSDIGSAHVEVDFLSPMILRAPSQPDQTMALASQLAGVPQNVLARQPVGVPENILANHRKMNVIKKLAKARSVKARKQKDRIRATLAQKVVTYVDNLKISSARCAKVQICVRTRKNRSRNSAHVAKFDDKDLHLQTRETPWARKFGFRLAIDLEIAYKQILRAKDVATSMGWSPKHVRSCRARVALAFLTYQEVMLQKVLDFCKSDPPVLAVHGLRFDEAKQRVSVKLSCQLTDQHSNASWNTLLARRFLYLAWSDGRAKRMDIICPPETVNDTSASACFEALHSPTMRNTLKLIAEICDQAQLQCEARGTDGAASNCKLLAHEFASMSKTLRSPLHTLCRNHQNHLIGVSLATLFSVNFTHNLYSTVVLIRTGSNFLRLVAVVKRVISEKGHLKIRHESVPDAHKAFAEQ